MISYRPLFKTMAEKNISSYALFKMGFSKATYHSIKKGNSISTNTVNQLCRLLQCSVSDIMEYIDDEPRGLKSLSNKINVSNSLFFIITRFIYIFIP